MANYNIMGGDGRQYGPISGEELRKWFAQGRLNGKSLTQAEGAAEWLPLESFAEFADVFRPASAGLPPMIPTSPEEYSKQILAREPDLRMSECIKAGFSFFTGQPGFVIGTVLIACLLNVIMSVLPVVGGILHLILSGVVTGGLYLTCIRRMRGEKVSVGNVFDGFKLCFVQLMLTGAVSQFLIQLGVLFCFLPGLYLFIAWTFALPLVADKRLEFWSALELSRKVTTRVWFQVFIIRLVIFLPFIIVGAFFTVKATLFAFNLLQQSEFNAPQAMLAAWNQRGDILKAFLPLAVVSQIVFFICQFFAVGALMRAYENLFGQRR